MKILFLVLFLVGCDDYVTISPSQLQQIVDVCQANSGSQGLIKVSRRIGAGVSYSVQAKCKDGKIVYSELAPMNLSGY